MLCPETDFIGQADKDMVTLVKIFRRYSRCDDFRVTPPEHARRIFDRISQKFGRHAAVNTDMERRFAKRMWPAVDLIYQLGHDGCPKPDMDIGLKDREAIRRVFFEIRDNLSLNAQRSELTLGRA